MKHKIRIYGDFNNADKLGRIRLLESSQKDFTSLGITPKEAMEVEVYDNDLSADGIVHFSDFEKIWVVEIDWKKIKDKDKDNYSTKNFKIAEENKMDDENGNCKQCGHPFNPHIVIAYDTKDFSKGGEMRCPVDGCKCFNTLDFNFSKT